MSAEQFTVSGNPDQIEKQLEDIRQSLTKTIDSLVGRVKPANLFAEAKANAKVKSKVYRAEAEKLLADAKNGDAEALKKLAIAGGVLGAIVGLVAWRIAR